MFFRKRVPGWVKGLSNSSNKELLTQLSHASNKPLDTPREMNFAIKNLKDKKDAEAAAHHLSVEGWECKIAEDATGAGTFWIEATKQDYSITEPQLQHDEMFASKIAHMFGATYDGWYAKVVK